MYSAINIVNKGHITITFHYLHVFKVLTSNNSFHGYPGPSSLTKRDPFSEHAHFGSFHILPSVVTLCLVYPPTWKAGNLGKAKSSLTHLGSQPLKVWPGAFPQWALKNAWRENVCIMEGEGLGTWHRGLVHW